MNRPMIGVGVIVRKDNKILIGKRLCQHAYGLYQCPGGHLEQFEDFSKCAKRELYEEVGNITVTTPKLWTVTNTMFKDENKHYVVVFMVCDWIHGEPANPEPEKLKKWEWAEWYNLPRPLMPGLNYLLKRNLNPFVIDNQYYEDDK